MLHRIFEVLEWIIWLSVVTWFVELVFWLCQ